MNNQSVTQFQFNTSSLRVVDVEGSPWFVAADVCCVLDISNTSDALKRLDDDERARLNLGRQGITSIINESGLYSLILGSRKPEAKAFKKWVTSEVLPSIRKTGSYSKQRQLIRTATNNGQTWYVGMDVARFLGCTMLTVRGCRTGQRAKARIDTIGGPQELIVIDQERLDYLSNAFGVTVSPENLEAEQSYKHIQTQTEEKPTYANGKLLAAIIVDLRNDIEILQKIIFKMVEKH